MAPEPRRGLQCYSFIKQTMEITDFDSDQWISFTVISVKSNYLFAVYESTVRVREFYAALSEICSN
jgi:hypothetical protein